MYSLFPSKYPKSYTTLYPNKEAQEKNLKKFINELDEIIVDDNCIDPIDEWKSLLNKMKKEAV